ncbi:hypothetical protein K8R14_04005 [bacterium]|nr:hypothetical protein [bacterium]
MITELGLIKLGICLEAFFYTTIALVGSKRGGKLGKSMFRIGLISLLFLFVCLMMEAIISSGSRILYVLVGLLIYKAVLSIIIAWIWFKKT